MSISTNPKASLTDTATNVNAPKLKELINTPGKKFAFIGLICSQLLIFGFFAIAGVIGTVFHLSVEQIASLGGGLWLLGEVMFFACIAILGRPVFNTLKTQMKTWLKSSKVQK